MKYSVGQFRCFNTWALLECDDNIGKMYRSLYSLEYFYKPKIHKPLWGTHITVIRGETILNYKVRHDLQDMIISFYYIPEICTNGVHFWLPVICPILDTIRQEFGLGKSLVNYHLSVGNICNGSGYTQPEHFL